MQHMVSRCKRNMSFFYYALIGVLVVLGIILSIFAFFRSSNLKPVLVQTPSPVIPSANITKQPHVQDKDQEVKKVEEYGIAAGGGLTYFDQNELNQYFNYLKLLGVQWVRWDINWGTVQPDNVSGYKWDGTDRVVATAKRYGIKSLCIITYAPKWVADQSCNDDYGCAPADPKAFGHFAGRVASRYKNSVSYWEIGNEPNHSIFWKPKPDAKKYAEVLKEAYLEIKRSNPQSLVLSGGLSSTGNEPDGRISPLTFMQILYASGYNQYFDGVALHPYSYPLSLKNNKGWNGWQYVFSVRQLMVTNGDSAKKIWVTEYGAPTGGPGIMHDINQLDFTYNSDYMSEAAQQEMALQVTMFYSQNIDWMGPFFWYSLEDNGTSRDTPENFFGLLRFDGSKKPAYDVFRNAIFSNQ